MLQRSMGMYTENGLSLDYRNASMRSSKVEYNLFAITSVLGSALGTNALRQAHFGLSSTYFFRKDKALRSYVRLGVAYFVSEKTAAIFETVPRKDTYIFPETGIRYAWQKTPLSLLMGLGYRVQMNPENQSPGTLNPLFYHLTLSYVVFTK